MRACPPTVLDALAADGELQVVEHNAVPINFACPNVIVQAADGTRDRHQRRGLAVVGRGGAR